MNGYFCQGFNPLLSFPNRKKCTAALSKLKFLVTMDPLETETSRFWENHGEHNDVDPAQIQTEVIQLPSTCFAEDEGSLTNSGRWLQWHWAGGTPPGEAKTDIWIMAQIYLRLKALYEGGRAGSRTDRSICAGPMRTRTIPNTEEIAKEINGYAITHADGSDRPDQGAGREGQAGRRASRSSATTAPRRAAAGSIPAASTRTATTWPAGTTTDPDDAGIYPNWAFSWPANRRILYNRASADLNGKPWDPSRKLIEWNGEKWAGYDVPDIAPTAKPGVVGPFIMNPEGTARLFTRAMMRDGPFPVHYEPFESPIANPIAPNIRGNPVARVFKGDMEQFGDAKEFPYAATSYRLTEHFHFWTKHVQLNAVMQPEFFVEISEQLAQEKGINLRRLGQGVVEPRLGEGEGGGDQAHHAAHLRRQDRAHRRHPAALGLHRRRARRASGRTTLTPYVGDANIETPEYKAFLVDIEPIPGPVA